MKIIKLWSLLILMFPGVCVLASDARHVSAEHWKVRHNIRMSQHIEHAPHHDVCAGKAVLEVFLLFQCLADAIEAHAEHLFGSRSDRLVCFSIDGEVVNAV